MIYITKNASGTYYYSDPEKTIAHREDGPAIEAFNGDEEWYIDGVLHRENDLPAVEYANGDQEYFVNGIRHRINGPACAFYNVPLSYIEGQFVYDYKRGENVEYVLTWFVDGEIHRLDGPAVELANGYEAWYLYDKLHRMDGPAVNNVFTPEEWFYFGTKINCSTQEEYDVIVSKMVN